ncbi:MAG: hypothetical protein RQ761_02425 [Bacteroidales bacterium]|nr:hypothetical protein [Bacteroidales bacterium]
MKKIFYLFGIMILASMLVFTSCNDDDDEVEPVKYPPEINFIGGANYISADATLTAGAEFKVGINASENATTQKNITAFKVVRTFNNVPTTVFDTDAIDDNNYSWESTENANSQAGEERWTFKVTDKAGESNELSFIITTSLVGVEIATYTNKTMGSWNDPTYGSFFATETGTVHTKAQATANQAAIDFAFYLGATNGSTFGAPSNQDIDQVFDLGDSGWTIFNETLFDKASINATEFNAIGDTYTFPEFTGTSDDINLIQPGDVIYFLTDPDKGRKHGFIKVNSINAKGDIINIDVKVQK